MIKELECSELQRLNIELGTLLEEKSSLREQIESAILDPARRRATLTLLTSKIDQALRSIANTRNGATAFQDLSDELLWHGTLSRAVVDC